MQNDIEWFDAVDIIKPHVVRISTPRGSGTGFLLAQAKNRDFSAIATAAHVIDHAHYWEQPIRIEHAASGKTVLLRAQDRVIFIDEEKDTAGILFDKDKLPLPVEPLPLTAEGKYLRLGNEVGWLGYPAVSPRNLCFFTGRVSHYDEAENTYLIDGVAINGVSGGPTFFQAGPAVRVIGIVSAYIANRATGETLPGVALVSGMRRFHDWLKTIASLDAAKAEETKLEDPPPPDAPAA